LLVKEVSMNRFDYTDGDYCIDLGGNMMMDSNGDLMQNMGGGMAMDMSSGEMHIVDNSYDDSDDFCYDYDDDDDDW